MNRKKSKDMKIQQKSLFQGMTIAVLFLAIAFSSCQKKPDSKLNQLLIYNATQDTLAIECSYAKDDAVYPGKYFKMIARESYTLYHLIDGLGPVSVYKNGQLVAEWNEAPYTYIISRPDSECHCFNNLQSWEERKGGKNDKYIHFIFPIRPENLQQID